MLVSRLSAADEMVVTIAVAPFRPASIRLEMLPPMVSHSMLLSRESAAFDMVLTSSVAPFRPVLIK
jgi:hypothetical protein